jgi:hypothetical protein
VCAIVATAPAAVLGQAVANGDVPRTIFITTQDGEFRKMDADHNGQVTRAEIEAFERVTAVATARARSQAMFAELDADKNGQLTQAEFDKLISGVPPVDGRPLIAALDTNKDGQVSLIEFRAGKLARFDQIDTDKDGVVSVAEMKAAGVIK